MPPFSPHQQCSNYQGKNRGDNKTCFWCLSFRNYKDMSMDEKKGPETAHQTYHTLLQFGMWLHHWCLLLIQARQSAQSYPIVAGCCCHLWSSSIFKKFAWQRLRRQGLESEFPGTDPGLATYYYPVPLNKLLYPRLSLFTYKMVMKIPSTLLGCCKD